MSISHFNYNLRSNCLKSCVATLSLSCCNCVKKEQKQPQDSRQNQSSFAQAYIRANVHPTVTKINTTRCVNAVHTPIRGNLSHDSFEQLPPEPHHLREWANTCQLHIIISIKITTGKIHLHAEQEHEWRVVLPEIHNFIRWAPSLWEAVGGRGELELTARSCSLRHRLSFKALKTNWRSTRSRGYIQCAGPGTIFLCGFYKQKNSAPRTVD